MHKREDIKNEEKLSYNVYISFFFFIIIIIIIIIDLLIYFLIYFYTTFYLRSNAMSRCKVGSITA